MIAIATEKVAVPAVSEAGVVSKWSELDGGGSGSKAIERVKNRDYDGSLYMVNKPPRWNDQVFTLVCGLNQRAYFQRYIGGGGVCVYSKVHRFRFMAAVNAAYHTNIYLR